MAVVVVKCDGCGATFTGSCRFGGQVRAEADEAGWLCAPAPFGEQGYSSDYGKPDWCPTCRPAEPD